MNFIFPDSAHDCLLSPTRVATTGCQYYFLFIGRLSKSVRGREALDQRSILGHFTELLSMRSDLYLKLVISCLDYSSMEWCSRILLSKALKEGSETCRYSTNYFLIPKVFKKLVKSKVYDYWEKKLRKEAAPLQLKSLRYCI